MICSNFLVLRCLVDIFEIDFDLRIQPAVPGWEVGRVVLFFMTDDFFQKRYCRILTWVVQTTSPVMITSSSNAIFRLTACLMFTVSSFFLYPMQVISMIEVGVFVLRLKFPLRSDIVPIKVPLKTMVNIRDRRPRWLLQ